MLVGKHLRHIFRFRSSRIVLLPQNILQYHPTNPQRAVGGTVPSLTPFSQAPRTLKMLACMKIPVRITTLNTMFACDSSHPGARSHPRQFSHYFIFCHLRTILLHKNICRSFVYFLSSSPLATPQHSFSCFLNTSSPCFI